MKAAFKSIDVNGDGRLSRQLACLVLSLSSLPSPLLSSPLLASPRLLFPPRLPPVLCSLSLHAHCTHHRAEITRALEAWGVHFSTSDLDDLFGECIANDHGQVKYTDLVKASHHSPATPLTITCLSPGSGLSILILSRRATPSHHPSPPQLLPTACLPPGRRQVHRFSQGDRPCSPHKHPFSPPLLTTPPLHQPSSPPRLNTLPNHPS